MPIDLDSELQRLISTGIRRASSVGNAKSGDILVLVAEPGVVADMIQVLLSDTVVGTTDSGTTVAILVGEAREALLRALPEVRIECDSLDDEWIPVVQIDANNLLSMTACRLVDGGRDRRWRN